MPAPAGSASSSAGYASAYPDYVPDSRRAGRVSIAHVLPPSKDISRRRGGLPADLVFASILANSLLALGLHLVKEWLLAANTSPNAGIANTNSNNSSSSSSSISVAEIHWRILAIAAAILALWHRPWELFSQRMSYARVALCSVIVCAESYAYMKALECLPVLRLVMLTESSHAWTHGFQSMRRKGSSSARNANFIAVATLGACYITEVYLNRRLPSSIISAGYASTLCYLFLKASGQDLLQSLSTAASPGASEDFIPKFYALGMCACVPIAYILSLLPLTGGPEGLSSSASPASSSTGSGASLSPSVTLATCALLALALFVLEPLLARAAHARTTTIRGFRAHWPIASLTAAFIGIIAFARTAQIADFAIGGIAYWGISHILHSDPKLVAEYTGGSVSSFVNGGSSSSGRSGSSKRHKETALEAVERQYRHVRGTIKTILENPDSKKIYYFLCLNLAFMFVQMMYGIWTNSLGLISDSIHMFFDCLALAMGLLASVMATWPRNETFTYGYLRVETLSGFANGIFLVLISIFIVFEAVQRLIDPPDMNTNQLLFVSGLGLAVNLVGMFATGHHHHHGHSHGHYHGHGDEHDHHHHGHSHNMHGVFLHVMADTLGSVGVIISTLLINRYGWTGFDPIASIFIAVLIFASVIPLIMDSASVLCLDMGTSREKDVRSALAKLSSVEGLSSYAAARFWPKDPSTVVGSIHIQLAPSPSHDHQHQHGHSSQSHAHTSGFSHYADAEKVVKRVEAVLKGAISGLVELSVQVEPSEGDVSCPCMVTVPSWEN